MNAKTLFAGTSIALALAAAAAPAHATLTTFAEINVTSNSPTDFYYKSSTSGPASIYSYSPPAVPPRGYVPAPSGVAVNFSFVSEGMTLDNAVGNVTAILVLNGTTNGVSTISHGFVTQELGPVSFSLKSVSAITVGSHTYAAGSNFLSGTFTGGVISGKSSNGSIIGDNTVSFGDTLTYTSDFVSFIPSADLGASFALTAIAPTLNKVGANLNSFKADLGGQFSANPVPTVNGVPEPASWALMIVGFGLAGASVRRRARVQTAA